MEYNGAMYRYVHSLQGDIIGIVDSSEALVVEYKYDAWGRELSVMGSMATTLGALNPFRYRGYVFDEETGLYYLQSRFFNATTSRFTNLDALLGLCEVFGLNVFCYCLNNSIQMIDPSGRKAFPTSGTLFRYLLERLVIKYIPVDWLGKKLLSHWIDGGGEKITIKNDKATNEYLWKSNKVQSKLKALVVDSIRNGNERFYTDDLETGVCDETDIGGYSSGYNIINLCTISVRASWKRGSNGNYQITADYCLIDKIDANRDNPSDIIFLCISKFFILNGNSGIDYDLEITGTWEFPMSAAEIW